MSLVMEDKTSDDTSTWLDKEFVQTLLRNNENDDSIVVKEMTVRPAVGKGENYISQLHRVAVDFTRDGGISAHRSLIVKSLPEGEMLAKIIIEGGIFERETRMYMETLPALHRIQQEHSPNKSIETLFPRFYKTSRPHTLILDDLCPKGYKMAERHRGLDLQHSKLALRAIARLHALSIALLDQDPTSMDFYTELLYKEEKREFNKQFQEPAINMLSAVVEKWPDFERFGDKLRSIEWVDVITELVKAKTDGISVLNHGDGWTNNMLFKYSAESGEVESIKLLDYQISRFSSPALDIQYFMFSSPTQEVRERHWDEVIEEYYKAVVTTLKAVGLESKAFSFDKLKEEIREKAVFGVLTACQILPVVLADPEDAPNMENMSEETMATNMEAANFGKVYSGERFREVFQKMLTNFEKYGYL